jgi:hypothetical protein
MGLDGAVRRNRSHEPFSGRRHPLFNLRLTSTAQGDYNRWK